MYHRSYSPYKLECESKETIYRQFALFRREFKVAKDVEEPGYIAAIIVAIICAMGTIVSSSLPSDECYKNPETTQFLVAFTFLSRVVMFVRSLKYIFTDLLELI